MNIGTLIKSIMAFGLLNFSGGISVHPSQSSDSSEVNISGNKGRITGVLGCCYKNETDVRLVGREIEPILKQQLEERCENPDNILFIRDGKPVFVDKSQAYSYFGPKAIKEHKLRSQKKLAKINPEDYMQHTNLFCEAEKPTLIFLNILARYKSDDVCSKYQISQLGPYYGLTLMIKQLILGIINFTCYCVVPFLLIKKFCLPIIPQIHILPIIPQIHIMPLYHPMPQISNITATSAGAA